MVDQVELVERLRAIDSEAEAWLAIEEAADTIEELVEALDYLVNAGLKLTDEGRNRADAVLAKVRTPTTPERSDDE